MGRYSLVMSVYLLVVMVGLGCSSSCTSSTSNVDRALSSLEDTTQIQLPMPEQTVGVLRVNLEQADVVGDVMGLDRLVGSIDPSQWLIYALIHPRSPLMDGRASLEGLRSIQGMDQSRDLVVALTTRGNDEHLRHLKYGVPTETTEGRSRGFSWRLFIPTEDSRALQQELEDSEYLESRYPREVEITDHLEAEQYLVVEVHRDPALGMKQVTDRPAGKIDLSINDADFWNRMTPAQTQFLGADAGMALYLDTERMAEVAAMLDVLGGQRAIWTASPDNRQGLLTQVFRDAGQTMTLGSPEVREVEDMTLLIDGDEAKAWKARWVRSHTRQGRTMTKEGTVTHSFEREVLDDASIDFTWGRRDEPASGGRPGWLRDIQAADDPERALDRFAGATGYWLLALPALKYPVAFNRSLQNLDLDETQMGDWLDSTHGIRAIAASLDWKPSEESEMGIEVMGNVSVLMDEGWGYSDTIDDIATSLWELGLGEVEVQSQEAEEGQLFHLEIGSFDSIKDEVRIEGGEMALDIDSDEIVATLSAVAGIGDLVPPDLEALRAISVSSELSADYSLVDVSLEPGEEAFGEIIDGRTELVEVEESHRCEDGLRGASQDLFEAHEGQLRGWRDNSDEVDMKWTALQAQMSRCVEEPWRELSEWIGSRWSYALGIQKMKVVELEEASELFSDSCHMGYEVACEDKGEVRAVMTPRESLEVGSTPFYLDALEGFVPYMDVESVTWLFADIYNGGIIRDAKAQGLRSIEDQEGPSQFVGLGDSFPAGAIAIGDQRYLVTWVMEVSPDARASDLVALVSLLDLQDHRRPRRNLPSRPGGTLLQGPPWLSLVVQQREGEGGGESERVIPLTPTSQLEEVNYRRDEITLGSEIRLNGSSIAVEDLTSELTPTPEGELPALFVEVSEQTPISEVAVVYEAVAEWYGERYRIPPLFILVE